MHCWCVVLYEIQKKGFEGRLMKNGAEQRDSNVELLKISAILMIVLSHVIQTLSEENTYIDFQDYILNLRAATTNPQILTLSILRYSGALGNSIFFACSAWFLLDSKKMNEKKWWHMLLEVWFISIVILVMVYVLRIGNIDVRLLIQSLFPTTFSTNWYMTCYLLFYLLHPVLNGIIRRMSQRNLLKSATLLFTLYIGANFIKRGLFFSSNLALWISIYFGVAYMKLYLKDFMSSTKGNIGIMAVGVIGNIGLVLITNFLGLKIEFFADKLWYWYTIHNPCLILTAIALLNLAHKISWRNAFVNHISKLSM